MEHPPKQGLKPHKNSKETLSAPGFNGTSTKTRIETRLNVCFYQGHPKVLMEHPPKQGLKLNVRE